MFFDRIKHATSPESSDRAPSQTRWSRIIIAMIKATSATLRFRLMIWNATVVLLTAIVTLIGLREGVRLAILHEMDQILIEDAQELSLGVSELLPALTEDMRTAIDRKARGHRQHGWFARALTYNGEQVWASESAPPPVAAPLRKLVPTTIGDVRVVETVVSDQEGRQLRLRVGASLAFLDADMARIDRLVWESVAVVFFVAPLVGYWLAGRTTLTLRQLIRATARLRPDRLEERLPLRQTGDELDQLSETVNGLLNRIASYLARRRDFLANSAHELRTPVAAIRSTVEVALNAHRSKEEYEDLLAEVLGECQHLEVLVNQLLLLAETEGERLRTYGERVAFGAVVRTAVDMFQALTEEKGVDLRLDPCTSVTVEGNRHHLRQVLNNLLDNAIKFTDPGGRIHVSLKSEEQSAVLLVEDSGHGISERDLPHIFERFYRCDRSRLTSDEQRGTGLGLSICEAVVHAHGGQISVTSRLGAGTKFRVVLPLAKNAAPAEPATFTS